MSMTTNHTNDVTKRKHKLSIRALLRVALALFVAWGIVFWVADRYGEWGKVLLETVVATVICMVVLIIISNIYYSNRRVHRSKKNSLFMQLRK